MSQAFCWNLQSLPISLLLISSVFGRTWRVMSNYASIDARTMTYKFMKDLGSIALGYKVYNVLYTNRRNQP